MMTAIAALVRDSQTLNDARFSCPEPKRFFAIGFNWLTAAQMARKAAHLMNVIWDAPLRAFKLADARHWHVAWVSVMVDSSAAQSFTLLSNVRRHPHFLGD